jgi:TatD DNase family protein
MLIDTHAHLDFPEFADDLEAVVDRAQAAGVTRIISIGTGLETSARAIALTERFPGVVYAAVGVHPNHAHEERTDFIPALRDLAKHPGVVAIGEIGVDHYRLPEDESARPAIMARQMEAYHAQLELAVELGLNVVIHQRDAWEATLEGMHPFNGKLRGVWHCFGGTPAQMNRLIGHGHLVSFTGIVTFKNAPVVRDSAMLAPADHYMVETDSPYLAPMPFRGQRCEPAHTRLVAECIASERGDSLAEVAAETTRNAEAFFRFSRG